MDIYVRIVCGSKVTVKKSPPKERMGKATILQYSRINYRSINEGAIVNQIKIYQPYKYRQLSNDFGKKHILYGINYMKRKLCEMSIYAYLFKEMTVKHHCLNCYMCDLFTC